MLPWNLPTSIVGGAVSHRQVTATFSRCPECRPCHRSARIANREARFGRSDVKARKHAAMKAPRSRGLVALALGPACVLALGAVGCGGDEWAPSGVGPRIDTQTQALVDPTAASLAGDMVGVPPGPRSRRGADTE